MQGEGQSVRRRAKRRLAHLAHEADGAADGTSGGVGAGVGAGIEAGEYTGTSRSARRRAKWRRENTGEMRRLTTTFGELGVLDAG